MERSGPLSIVVAGASGYIGRALIPKLLQKFPQSQITALSRNRQVSDDARVTWQPCDLFSLKSLDAALPERVDLAFYLVHSMGPTAALDQGSFADYDLILADNFARGLKNKGLKQLIYLGGLIPENQTLSLHLQSRREIEEVFAEHALPTTLLRAGLILGDSGSSSQILFKLVRRLPVMLCPLWTQTLTTPVDLESVLWVLAECSLQPPHIGRSYDLASCHPITYVQIMTDTAQKMGLRRRFFAVPFFTSTLSRLWVSVITNSSRELVYPLIESLEHPMIAREAHLFPNLQQRTYFAMLNSLSLKSRKSGRAFLRFQAQRRTVRSVQRLPLPVGRDALWVKDLYLSWLPKFFSPFIQVYAESNKIIFSFLSRRIRLLEFELRPDRSNQDRQLLGISGGLLAHSENRGRLEFRTVLGRRYVLAAIHDFKPSLPWAIYRWTQALLHLWVMRAFARRLRSEPGVL